MGLVAPWRRGDGKLYVGLFEYSAVSTEVSGFPGIARHDIMFHVKQCVRRPAPARLSASRSEKMTTGTTLETTGPSAPNIQFP